MAIHVAVRHLTRYCFDRRVDIYPHVVRLRPAVHCRTPILGYTLKVEPDNGFLNWQQDPFGNWLGRLVFPEPARELSIDVELIADMTVINPFDFFLEEAAETFPFDYGPRLRADLAPYLECVEDGPLLQAWMADIPREPRPTVDFLVMVNQRLSEAIAYTVRMEPGVQSCEETLRQRLGSCRDSGWLLVQILRRLGLAARFVSGYLVQLKPDVAALNGPAGPLADFTDLHAWAEVYVPGAGWIGLDPTSGLFAGEGHIPLACTPAPASAAPISGATAVCETTLHHQNTVTRIHEDPRVTRPYSEEQWGAISRLGDDIDRQLRAQDVRLTMGGEPTFVAADNMDDPQWTLAADGAEKRTLAERLTRRLRNEFAPGSVLLHGQGKWYPGEALPRWQKACFWRRDEAPVWQHETLLADPEVPLGHTAEDARRFGERLVAELGLPAESLLPAFEDPFHALWQEGRLPLTASALHAHDLGLERERQRLRHLLAGDLKAEAGRVLPLTWADAEHCWQSSRWPLRDDRLLLVPGDSPLGFRLPLDSLPPESDAKSHVPDQAPDPMAPRSHLPRFHPRPGQSPAVRPVQSQWLTRGRVVHTALCLEVRDQILHVFLPPLVRAEAWLELVALVERVAVELRLPVILEGYEPPVDPRLRKFAVTPDPGVIEVNIHPAEHFRELCRNTETLYRVAHECGLAAEKFMLDGRHTGTGGGNHITLGGPTPADSPLLRNPSLLRSLLTYWQNHPSLSYLFSGLFVGPTSQAPRVDEARDDRLYELEIAFSQLPEGPVVEPWRVDRSLRHLLTDLTGNTHRAEFCIDKLYSPDSPTGRLGLLELRAFEMPPHPRLSVAQMLLLRALVAWFWQRPLRRPLVHWGTSLHDRFMLPHFVWADFREVITDLREAGYPFEVEWFAPFLEFRFPEYGHVQVGDLRLSLRAAIEPWHVLGEEASAQGTARYVDSSVERLQVHVSGMTDRRYQIACNGRTVPLRATGVGGEYVAGVRYRAWSPPSALHPTLGVDAPLVFDVIDTWNQRSVGGCTYFVSHAGGRSFETLPVNTYEAESRRAARFWGFGHTPGPQVPRPDVDRRARFVPEGSGRAPLEPPRQELNLDYPLTLDLRRGR